MSGLEIAVAVAAGVVLFLFGIEHFSAEVQGISGQRFRAFLARGTENRFLGFGLGAAVTAIIQSSSATSVIAVGLVNAGVLSFRQSLGVIFGANVGTTVTAQLVALKLTDFAPWLILLGFAAGFMPFRWRIFGKSIFYFGLVFFSLEMVSNAVAPLKSDPTLLAMMASLDSAWVAIAVGALFTAAVQSSSVTTGVAIVLMSQEAISLEAAIPLILGANIGTTSTSLLASAQMDTSARRTAVSHALYNVLGVVLFLPLLPWFAPGLARVGLEGATALAAAHLVFNLTAAVLFLAALEPFARMVEQIVPDDAAEEKPVPHLPPAVFDHEDFGRKEVLRWAGDVLHAQGRQYTMAVLAIETRDRTIDARARRTDSLVQYALEEGLVVVREVADREISEACSESVLSFVVIVDHLRQVHDSLTDLREISERMERHHARLSLEAILEVQAVFPVHAKYFQELGKLLRSGEMERLGELDALTRQAQVQVQQSYRRFLELVRLLNESAELADFLSIHQRLRTKLAAFGAYLAEGSAVPRPRND